MLLNPIIFWHGNVINGNVWWTSTNIPGSVTIYKKWPSPKRVGEFRFRSGKLWVCNGKDIEIDADFTDYSDLPITLRRTSTDFPKLINNPISIPVQKAKAKFIMNRIGCSDNLFGQVLVLEIILFQICVIPKICV
jgi:hypothetical protein